MSRQHCSLFCETLFIHSSFVATKSFLTSLIEQRSINSCLPLTVTKRLTYRPLSLYSLVIRAGRLKLLVCVSLCHGCQKRLFLGGYFFFLRELTHGGWHRQTHREVASVLYCNMKGEETQCSSSTWHYLALTCRYSSQTFCDLHTILTMYESEPAERASGLCTARQHSDTLQSWFSHFLRLILTAAVLFLNCEILYSISLHFSLFF